MYTSFRHVTSFTSNFEKKQSSLCYTR